MSDHRGYEMALAEMQDRLAAKDAEIARLVTDAFALERERIAQILEAEADACPCTEDAAVTRGNAMLVRADGSYDEAEKIEGLVAALQAEVGRLRSALVRIGTLPFDVGFYPDLISAVETIIRCALAGSQEGEDRDGD